MFRPILTVSSLISEHLINLISKGYIHLQSNCKIHSFNEVSPSDNYNSPFIGLLNTTSATTSAEFSQQLLAVFLNTSVRHHAIIQVTSFIDICIINTYIFVQLMGFCLVWQTYQQYIPVNVCRHVRKAVYLRRKLKIDEVKFAENLPSDSISRWTSFPYANGTQMIFPITYLNHQIYWPCIAH